MQTTVRKGVFRRDAQCSLTYGRMCFIAHLITNNQLWLLFDKFLLRLIFKSKATSCPCLVWEDPLDVVGIIARSDFVI